MADQTPKSLDEALLLFQADPPTLKKDKSAHQSKYADLVQAHAEILPRLNALGLLWITCPTQLDDGKFVLEYELKHVPSGEAKTGRWPLKLSENPQQMGSAVSYARRYALQAVTGVAAEDEDDDGQAASGQRTAQRRPRNESSAAAPAGRTVQRAQRPAAGRPPLPGEDPDGKVGQDQHRHMHALWRDLGMGGEEHREQRLTITARILRLDGLESSADLTRAQADTVIAALRAKKEEQQSGGES